MNWQVIIIFIFIIFFEILAIYYITEWSEKQSSFLILNGIVAYILVALLLAMLLLRITSKKLAIANGLWQVINLILITILGIFIYQNKLLWYQWFGIGLAILATILLSYGEYVQNNGNQKWSLNNKS